MKILTEPKNALVKQYQKLLSFDGVNLEFDTEAIERIADKAIERKTGARGLRSIMEETMSDIMFHAPSDENITECHITLEMVEKSSPQLSTAGEKPQISAPEKKEA